LPEKGVQCSESARRLGGAPVLCGPAPGSSGA